MKGRTCWICGKTNADDAHIDTHVPDATIAMYVDDFPTWNEDMIRWAARAHIFTTQHQRRRCTRCFGSPEGTQR